MIGSAKSTSSSYELGRFRKTSSGDPNQLVSFGTSGHRGTSLKVVSISGWFAARPSGTEHIYKLYAESLKSADHLAAIVEQAQEIVSRAIGRK
jgi:phosphoglucomutase